MGPSGIYYSLPKTQAHIAIPVSVEQLQSGRVGKIYDQCLAACAAGTVAQPKECELPRNTTVQILKPEITLKGAPDPSHTYYVTMNAELFSSIKHQMSFDESGVIADASSSGANMTFEVVGGVIKTVASVVGSGLFSLARERIPAQEKQPPKVDNALTCSDAKTIGAALKGYEEAIAKERQVLDKWLRPGAKPRVDPEFAKLLITRSNERVAEIKDKAAKYRTAADLDVVKKTFKYTLRSTEPLSPSDFAAIAPTHLDLKQDAPADEAEASRPALADILKDRISFYAGLAPKVQIPKCENAACREPDPAGYRYRIPALGQLTLYALEVADPLDHSKDKRHDLVVDAIPVAQYGPVASLPSRFEGKGGSVELAISPITGGLKKVTIGSDALPATAVTAPLESLRSGLEDRSKRKEADAEKARNADKTALERERDLLKLQKEIKDLRSELGQ